MRRDSGHPVVEGAGQIDLDQQAISGQWDYKTGGPVDDMLQGWTLGGQAIVTEFGHGCGICGLWRLDPPASMSSPFSQRTAFDSLVAMPSGDWVVISGEGPAVADSSPHGTALPPSSYAAESRGTFLLDIARLRLVPVDQQTGPLAYWGAEGLPFVETGGATGMVAIGPGQRRELPRLGGRNVSVSLGDRWRVIHGPGGLWFFDDQSRLRGSWTEASVLDVAWSPSADRLLWLAGTSLWQMAVPDGAAVRLSDWHRTERPGYAAQDLRLSLGWLAR